MFNAMVFSTICGVETIPTIYSSSEEALAIPDFSSKNQALNLSSHLKPSCLFTMLTITMLPVYHGRRVLSQFCPHAGGQSALGNSIFIFSFASALALNLAGSALE